MQPDKTLRWSIALALSALVVCPAVAGMGEGARAVSIVQRMVELNESFATYYAKLVAPEAIAGASGTYVLPVNSQGQLTGRAEKAIHAQVGDIAGEQAGTAALGGKEYIKSRSSLSFDTTDDYAVYLHAKLAGTPEYQKARTAAIALYPNLETS